MTWNRDVSSYEVIKICCPPAPGEMNGFQVLLAFREAGDERLQKDLKTYFGLSRLSDGMAIGGSETQTSDSLAGKIHGDRRPETFWWPKVSFTYS